MRILLLVVLFCFTSLYSQETRISNVRNLISNKNQNALTDLQGVTNTVASYNSINGSPYLFNEFQTDVVIKSDLGKDFIINNININVLDNSFVSQISKDSVFTFNKIKEATINGRKYILNNNKILEVLLDDSTINLYKFSYKLEKREVTDPMTKQVISPKSYFLRVSYFYSKDNMVFKALKFKRNNILPLIDSKNKEVNNYVKKHNLSLKNEKDVVKIFKYFDSLQNK